jgi:hypothetical protein
LHRSSPGQLIFIYYDTQHVGLRADHGLDLDLGTTVPPAPSPSLALPLPSGLGAMQPSRPNICPRYERLPLQ